MQVTFPPYAHNHYLCDLFLGECLGLALTRIGPRGVRTYIFHPSKTCIFGILPILSYNNPSEKNTPEKCKSHIVRCPPEPRGVGIMHDNTYKYYPVTERNS